MPSYAMLLRQERRNMGLTQEQVAEHIGSSTSTVSRWEAGHHMPTPHYIARLSKLFHKNAKALGLAEEEGNPPSASSLDARAPERLMDPQVPPVLACVERDQEQATLKACLMQAQPPTLTVISGLAGVGKTTLLASIAQDHDLLARYPDGLLWVTFGPHPDIQMHSMRWSTLLHLPREASDNLHTWPACLRQILCTHQMLIVLDDVWDEKDVLALLVAGSRSAYVVTTRFPWLMTSLRSVHLSLLPWTLSQSETWFHMIAPASTHLDPHAINELLREAGGLPLAVTLMGHYLQHHARDEQPRRIASALAALTNAHRRLALLLRFDSQYQVSTLTHADPTCTLASVFASMVSPLEEQHRQVLFALSVFPPAPATFSEESALHIAACSVDALDALTDSGVLHVQTDRYQLHPLMRAYAVQCFEQHPRDQQDTQNRCIQYVLILIKKQGQKETVFQREEAVVQAALDLAWNAHDEPSALSLTAWLTSCWLHNHQWEQAETAYTKAFPAACRHAPRTALSFSLERGRCLLALQQHEKAIQAYQKALPLARNHGTQEEQFTLLLQLAAVCIQTPRQGPFQPHVRQAFSCCLEAENLLKQMPAPQQLSSQVQQVLPLLYEMRGTLELWMGAGRQAAMEHYHAGIVLAEHFQSLEAWSLLLIMRARAWLYGLDEHASEQDLHHALTLATQARSSLLVQQCLQGRLDLLLATGRVVEAQAVLTDLKQAVTHPDVPDQVWPHERFCSLSSSHGEGWVALYEGWIAFSHQDLEAAEYAFAKAAHDAHQMPEERALLLLILQQQARVALARESAGEALQLIGKLEECIPATHRGLWRGHVYALRAHCMRLYMMPQQARREIQQSRAIFEQYGYLLGIQMLDA